MDMKLIKNIVIYLFCFVCCQVFAQQDTENILNKINNGFTIDIAGLDLGYKENIEPRTTNDGSQPKNTESGTIAGIAFNARHIFVEKIYTEFYLDYFKGKLKSDMATFTTMSYTPSTKYNQHSFLSTNIKTGYILRANESFQVIPYIGVGFRYWDRHNVEKYHHYQWSAGLKLDYFLTNHLILSPYFEAGRIFEAHIKCKDVDLYYKLGNKPLYIIGLELNYEMTKNLFINTFVNYTYFKYGQSVDKYSNKAGDTYYEPGSKTQEIKFGLGLRF
jgi:hypothetical protein